MFKTNLPIVSPARAAYYIMTGEQYLNFLQNDLIAYGWGEGTNLFNIIKDDVNWALSLKIVPFNIDTTKSYFKTTNTIMIADNTLTDPKEVIYRCSANNSDEPTVTFKFFSSELEDILTNSFIDYNNFSEYLLYLPFFGYTTLAYESIVNSNSISIDYFFDYTTCELMCNVEISNKTGGTYRIYEDSKNIGIDLPLINIDSSGYIRSISNALTNIMTGSSAILGGSNYVTSTTRTMSHSGKTSSSSTIRTKRNPKTNRQIITSKKSNESMTSPYSINEESISKTSYSGIQAAGEVLNGLSEFITAGVYQDIKYGGNVNSLINSLREPFILYSHPTADYFDGFNHLYGRPLNEYKVLSSMSGFTKLSSIHLNIPATLSELEEIENLLYEGVIINNGTPSPEPPIEPTPPIEPEPEPEPEPDPKPDPEPDPEPPEEYRPYEEGKEMICCFNGRFRLTSPRGWRTLNGVRDYHKGIDLVGEDSHVVYAICDGYCTTRFEAGGFGNYVTQTIADGRRIFYAHLASFSIMDNQYVTAGTPIGIMGATGNVTGAHTHLELRPAGTTSESLDINAFTGIPNVVGNYTGVPTYAVAESAELQAKVGLENQTIEYLNKYEYAPDLIRKLNDKIE